MGVNRSGPPCPECGSLITDVSRTSRSPEGHFCRRRDCPSCGAHFMTIQHAELVAPKGSVRWQNHIVHVNWSQFRAYFASLLTP